jgi:cytochrome c-type biogenesis protein CcmH
VSRRRGLRPLVLAVVVIATAPSAGGATAVAAGTQAAPPAPRTSLPIIERQVMCVTCKIPLNVAQSPQADRERAFIQELIDKGENEAQIKRALVGQYGQTALALPSDHGFDRAAYLIPLAAVLLLLGALAVLLPRWRRHARSQLPSGAEEPKLSSSDAARLEADLTRFD